MAAAAGASTTISSVLNNVTPKGVQFINAWIRDYPELAYVGFYMPNYYADGGKMKRGGLTYAQQKSVNFKTIGALEADMSINQNEVTWYEAGLLLEETTVTATVTTNTVVPVAAATIKFFKAGDVIVLKPKAGGSTAEVQAEIVSVNTTTNELTLDTAVSAVSGDRILLAYNLISYGTEINRGVATGDMTPVKTYFQTFGESMEFDSNEINQTRLIEDAQTYVNGKFTTAIAMSNNRIGRAWYLGRNIPGAKSETQGLEHVIAEAESKFGPGSAIINFAGITDAKAKAKKIVQVINYLNTAPVYTGTESPTFYCNDSWITALSEIMFDMGNQMTLKEKEIEFGLQAYSSPFFRNVTWITSHLLNRLEPTKSVAYGFPKHLVTFRTPEYQSVNESGALVKTSLGQYTVLKMPQVSPDKVKYTAQLRLANIFGGQTFKGAYAKLINL